MPYNLKLYLVRFSEKSSSRRVFYKFGVTRHYDVMERFLSEEYNDWCIDVVCSAYGPGGLVKRSERYLLDKYSKNLWIDKPISGVTEIVFLSRDEVIKATKLILHLREEWYNMRHE